MKQGKGPLCWSSGPWRGYMGRECPVPSSSGGKKKRPPWKAFPFFFIGVPRNHMSYLWTLWLCPAPSISWRIYGFLNLKEEPRFPHLCFYPWNIPSWPGKEESHNGAAQRLVVNSQRSPVGPVTACLFLTGSSGKCIQNKAGDWLTPKEFLMEGKMSKSKDWKRVVQCKQKTLRFLEQVC